MEQISTWSQLLWNSLQAFGAKIGEAIPTIIFVIVIFLLGWIVSKIIARIVYKILNSIKFDSFAAKFGATDFLEKTNVSITPSRLVEKFIYLILMLLVVLSASDAVGWSAVSNEVSKLISLLPNILFAIIFFIIGYYIANILRGIIRGATDSLGISAGKTISKMVFYVLLVIITLSSLNQAGFNTDIITSNFMLFLGAILIAAAISYGFASQTILTNILSSIFNRNTFKIGQTIEVDNCSGKITNTTNTTVTIQEDSGSLVVIPSSHLLKQKVRITNQSV